MRRQCKRYLYEYRRKRGWWSTVVVFEFDRKGADECAATTAVILGYPEPSWLVSVMTAAKWFAPRREGGCLE